MRVVRSIAAVLMGLAFLAATTAVWTIVARGMLAPGRLYLVMNLCVCGVGAVLGGWLAARAAPSSPYGHAAALAALVAVISIPSATGAPASSQPGWYAGALGFVAVLGVLLGGKLRAAAASAADTAVA
jgi:hypothetical protein